MILFFEVKLIIGQKKSRSCGSKPQRHGQRHEFQEGGEEGTRKNSEGEEVRKERKETRLSIDRLVFFVKTPMMKHLLFAILTVLLVTSCTLPAYFVREYTYLPAGLSKKDFRKAVEEKNKAIRAEDGYVKMYDLVKVDRSVRNKLYLEEWLFSDSYALPKDSTLIRTNLIRLSSIKDRVWVWPSVYPQMYPNKLNPNYWTAWMNRDTQQAIRDSIDMATTPILNVSRYKLDPKFYNVYKQAMRIKKFNSKKSR